MTRGTPMTMETLICFWVSGGFQWNSRASHRQIIQHLQRSRPELLLQLLSRRCTAPRGNQSPSRSRDGRGICEGPFWVPGMLEKPWFVPWVVPGENFLLNIHEHPDSLMRKEHFSDSCRHPNDGWPTMGSTKLSQYWHHCPRCQGRLNSCCWIIDVETHLTHTFGTWFVEWNSFRSGVWLTAQAAGNYASGP